MLEIIENEDKKAQKPENCSENDIRKRNQNEKPRLLTEIIGNAERHPDNAQDNTIEYDWNDFGRTFWDFLGDN